MKKLSVILLALIFSSCVLDYSLVSGDYDDLYARRHYDYNTNTWMWYQYQRSYVYPSPYNGFYPYERIIVTPLVVPQNKNYEYGKRPSRESIPNHAPTISGPRRGRN